MFSIKECEAQIIQYCCESPSSSPLGMAQALMEKGVVRLHGPEHHFLTAAVLSTAWYKLRREDPLPHLEKLRERCSKVAPAVCGYYGVCGDTMGAGAFLSEALEVNYLSQESWALLNKFTGQVQSAIGGSCDSGPRCCKRTSYAAISAAVRAVKELLDVELDRDAKPECIFCGDNPQCVAERCIYFPKAR